MYTHTRTVSNVCISSVVCCHEIWCIVSSVAEELGCLHLLCCRWWFGVLMQHWYLSIELCCVTSCKNTVFMFTYHISEQLKSQRCHICKESSHLLCVLMCYKGGHEVQSTWNCSSISVIWILPPHILQLHFN